MHVNNNDIDPHIQTYTPGVTSDKRSVVLKLQKMNFSMDRIIRAFKVYEHNYGKDYDFNSLIEIIIRLQKKDYLKNNNNNLNDDNDNKEEEKSFTTFSLRFYSKNYHFRINKKNKNQNSLSLSMSATTINKPLSKRSYSDIDNNNYTFVEHMNISSISLLPLYSSIDHRDNVGKYCTATIISHNKLKSEYKIHYDGFNKKYDIWCNYKKEYFRFAKYRSISRKFQNQKQNQKQKRNYNKLYIDSINIGDFVDIKPNSIYTKYKFENNKWINGIINKFDKKSDQIQIAFKLSEQNILNKTKNEYILYWTHIDNLNEIAPYQTHHVVVSPSFHIQNNNINVPLNEEIINQKRFGNNNKSITSVPLPSKNNQKRFGNHNPSKNKRRYKPKRSGKGKRKKKSFRTKKDNNCNDFRLWDTSGVIKWVNSIENGKFSDSIYDNFRIQIVTVKLNGYEIPTLNETALKFAGLLNKIDRKIVLNNIINLVNENKNQNNKNNKNTTKNGELNQNILDKNRVLKEVIELWNKDI